MGSHDHGHDVLPSSPRVRRTLTIVIVPLVLATVVSMVLLWPEYQAPPDDLGGDFYDATVTAIQEVTCPPEQRAAGLQRCGTVTIRLDEGPDAGREIDVLLPDGPGAPRVRPGDAVIAHSFSEPGDPGVRRYDIADHQRGAPLLWLVALFAVAILAFGRWRGVASLAGLAACFALLLTFVLPAAPGGHRPAGGVPEPSGARHRRVDPGQALSRPAGHPWDERPGDRWWR